MNNSGPTALFNAYLDWTESKIKKTLEKGLPCKKSKFAIPVLELPGLKNEAEYRRFFICAKEAGYNYFNIGLTSIWNNKLPRDFFAIANKIGINFASAHGTSLKYSFKYNVPYEKVLMEDKRSLALLGNNKIVINYDLFAGHLSGFRFSNNVQQSCERNSVEIANKLGFQGNSQDSEKYVFNHIIRSLAMVFRNNTTRTSLTLEIPGTKGWSMMPSYEILQSDYLLNLISTSLPESGITIDVAHLITWGKDKSSLSRAYNIIDKYMNLITMMHICSAGTDSDIFLELYKSIYKNKYPRWHIANLDASLFIFEEEMIKIISFIREKVKKPLLEVTESRLPSLTVADYFPGNGIDISDEWYYRMLGSHSKILQYV